ncbi:MAG: SUMF1/EgtB/PvdO family nonheme iron enzyme [bacterium]
MIRISRIIFAMALAALMIPAAAQAGGRTKCPAGMVLVAGRFCIDKYEYPNRKGEYAMNAATWDAAVGLCRSEGKRLCAQSEWQEACKGPRNYNQPYGNGYVKGACSDQYAGGGKGQYPSGEMEACVSGYGAADMSGNLWEWTSDVYDDGNRGIQGGSAVTKDESALACGNPSKEKPGAVDNYIGFRCCMSISKAGERSQVSPLVGYPPVRAGNPGLAVGVEYAQMDDIVNSSALNTYVSATGINLTASYQFDEARLDFTRMDNDIDTKITGVADTGDVIGNVVHAAVLLPFQMDFGDWSGDMSAGVRWFQNGGNRMTDTYLLKEFNNGRWSFAQAANLLNFRGGGKDRAGYSIDARYRLNRFVDIMGAYSSADFYKGYIDYYIAPKSLLTGMPECGNCRHETGTGGLVYTIPGGRGNAYLLYYDAGDIGIPMGGATIKF